MGLRLYQAPVESDIQSKPAAEKTSAQARSAIRRAPRSTYVRVDHPTARDRRRRILHAASRTSPPSEAPTVPSMTADIIPPSVDIPDNGRRALRHMASRLGILDDRVVAMFGERWAHLHAESNPSPSRDDEDNDPLSAMAAEPEFFPRNRMGMHSEPFTTSSMRSTQAPNHPSRTPSRNHTRWHRLADNLRTDSPTYLDGTGSFSYPYVDERAAYRRRREQRLATLESTPLVDFDGLGDRNRSLSPEGDNVWDTLLSTISPDPQPPSVGSSFASASASASAAASQGAATGSSRTSFAGPDTAEESVFEPPCDSGCENSDTEGDEDDEEQNPLTRFPGLRTSRRSYADVTRSSSTDDHLEMLPGGIGGMQRIVSNLARREDIPDEWWAEAGLSRTLSREASSN
ncbi:hypothetical protein B0T25DRAFT_534553 [Lasiosphaeria hispida]|uniref:Uncharacterized protein n=1 Tax=Lasiosphaeria hispida TaxID=260671 RepID=A0AAJ0HRK7_9PEZI|nr:hypothetical protein B0T25DRAFT_534553 [Lasiosphaeria hispida]